MRTDRRRSFGPHFLRALSATFVLAAGASAQNIWFVDASVPPGGSGASWTSAIDSLDVALSVATPADQIWVAAGVYRPQTLTIAGDPRSASFVMDGRRVFG